jgi:hypothetical protein
MSDERVEAKWKAEHERVGFEHEQKGSMSRLSGVMPSRGMRMRYRVNC